MEPRGKTCGVEAGERQRGLMLVAIFGYRGFQSGSESLGQWVGACHDVVERLWTFA